MQARKQEHFKEQLPREGRFTLRFGPTDQIQTPPATV